MFKWVAAAAAASPCRVYGKAHTQSRNVPYAYDQQAEKTPEPVPDSKGFHFLPGT